MTNRAGTSHLLAVSGLHLSVLTALLLSLLQRLRLPVWLRYPLTILFAFLFAGLVGFSASVLRAFCMTALALSARLIYRRSDPQTALGLALLIICWVWPHWTWGRGLWLSAASTLGIILFSPRLQAGLERRLQGYGRFSRLVLRTLLGAGLVSICAYAFTLPVMLAVNGWISLVSPLSNMLILPFVTLLLVGSIFCALAPASGVLAPVAALTHFCCEMIMGISRVLADTPWAVLSLDQAWKLIVALGALAGLVVLLCFRGMQGLAPCAAALLVLALGVGNLSFRYATRGALEVVTLQNAPVAMLLRDDQVVLMGTPDRYSAQELSRYLEFRGVRRISAVVAPEYPERMDSGILQLEERFGIDCVIGPDDVYILSLLETALPETQVVSGGYAQFLVLNAAVIEVEQDGSIRAQVGQTPLLKTREEYDILGSRGSGQILLLEEQLMLPPGVAPLFEPMGWHLFGETRLQLPV